MERGLAWACVMALASLGACGDNTARPDGQVFTPSEWDAPAPALLGEPCAKVPGAEISFCHGESGACVAEDATTVCRPFCPAPGPTRGCEQLGGRMYRSPSDAGACVCVP